MSEKKYLTTPEFAEAIGVAVITLKRWDKSGILYPHHKTPGGRRYYSQQQVDAYKKKYYNTKSDVLSDSETDDIEG